MSQYTLQDVISMEIHRAKSDNTHGFPFRTTGYFLIFTQSNTHTPANCQHGDLSRVCAPLHFPVRATPHKRPFLLIAAVTHVVVPRHSPDGVKVVTGVFGCCSRNCWWHRAHRSGRCWRSRCYRTTTNRQNIRQIGGKLNIKIKRT